MTEHMKNIRIVTVIFNIPIRNEELPLLRGAVIETTKRVNDFITIITTRVIYRYPRIQYKKYMEKQHWYVMKRTEAIHDFFSNTNWFLRLGNDSVNKSGRY